MIQLTAGDDAYWAVSDAYSQYATKHNLSISSEKIFLEWLSQYSGTWDRKTQVMVFSNEKKYLELVLRSG